MNPKLLRISFSFLFIVALLGVIMRLTTYLSISSIYTNILHAHSHVAFQGWVYLSFFYIITINYISSQDLINGRYKLQFLLTTLAITGVLVSFIYQGYGFYSILFSTLFQLLSYWFVARFFIDIKKNTSVNQQSISVKFIKTGLILYLISTLGPWAIAIISAKGLSGSEAYQSAIYFFLHFQYNGYFTFGALALLTHFIEKSGISTDNKKNSIFFYLFTASIIPAYFLSLIGMSFRNIILPIAYITSVIQLIALIFFILATFSSLKAIFKQNTILNNTLVCIYITAFLLKTLLQSTSVLDILETIAFTNRYIIMAFIHLTLIGFITFSLLAHFKQKQIIKTSTISTVGLWLTIVGFSFSELFLCLSGLGLQFIISSSMILIFSVLMLIGIGLILTTVLKN